MSDQNPKKHVIQPVGNLIQLLTPKTEKVEKCEMASDTNYYHYNCLSEDDYGWGCSYRCCQMIVSHYVIRSIIGITLEEVPSLKDIQCGLFEVGLFSQKDIGSHKWIEPPDVNAFVNGKFKLHGRDEVFIPSTDSKNDLYNKIKEHFNTVKTPIMLDDTIKSYILVGYYIKDGVFNLLRFDPHYYGSATYEKYVENKRSIFKGSTKYGVSWLPADIVFSTNTNKWLVLYPIRN